MARRIEPVTDAATGKALDLNPPCGGSWLRDVDGGLSPGDELTANAAGLQWGDAPAEPAAEIVPDPMPDPAPRKTGR